VERIDEEIERPLHELVEFTGTDRSTLFQFSPDGTHLRPSPRGRAPASRRSSRSPWKPHGPGPTPSSSGARPSRVTLLGATQYGLSFYSHTGRWEPMPCVGALVPLAHALVTILGPYLARPDLSGGIRGSGH
jgi:hypothetical protein